MIRAQEYRESVNLSDARRADLTARLDALSDSKALFDLGGLQRSPPKPGTTRVTVHQPGGSAGRFLISIRTASRAGAWFLHGSFLHPGTICVFDRATEPESAITARVKWCEHLEREVHAVAIEFDAPVEPASFLSQTGGAVSPAGEADAMPVASAPPVRLDGTILFVDDHHLDCALLAYHLRETGVRLLTAGTPGEALSKLRAESIDLFICDLNLGEARGERVIADARQQGFAGPILVLSAESSPARLNDAKAAGADAIIAKPYKPGRLIRVLAFSLERGRQLGHHTPGTSSAPAAPIYSLLAHDAGMLPLIEEFVAQMRTTAEELAACFDTQHAPAVRERCLKLKGCAGGFGFPVLAAAADRAVKAIETAQSIEDARSDLDLIRKVAERLRPGPPEFGPETG